MCHLYPISSVNGLIVIFVLVSQKFIINRVADNLARLKMHSGGHGPLKRMSEATGQWPQWIKTLAFLKPGFSESHNVREKCLLGVAVYS